MAAQTKYTPVAHQNRRTAMGLPTWLLPATLALLMIDAIIELSLISSMVSWLHSYAGGEFLIHNPTASDANATYSLHGKPLNLLVDQGHTSNGAAGTAFVLIGLGGILLLSLRHRSNGMGNTLAAFHAAWVVFTALSALLSLAALIFTFVLTNAHAGQTIDSAFAATLHNKPYPDYVAYPRGEWTPENWFSAVLQLDLRSASDRGDIASEMRIIRAWRWNLIPLFVLGLALSGLAVADVLAARRPRREVVEGKLQEGA